MHYLIVLATQRYFDVARILADVSITEGNCRRAAGEGAGRRGCSMKFPPDAYGVVTGAC
jgi:hypothetical protein